jgi:4-amino-4-deoxy-L-arabinose transferase-like glycosyltransferase
MELSHSAERPFFAVKGTWVFTLILLLVLGLGIRLYDLTDLPLDFHPTRQLLSALKARGIYYQSLTNVPEWQRNFAIQEWKLRAAVEPEVFERLVAFTYRFTGEKVWIARIYSSLFWVVGALFLFYLVRDLSSTDGALIATAFYLFLPYSVIASRSFQPDPLMVMLIIMFWWALLRWRKQPQSRFFAVVAGLMGGFAIFIKFVAAFFVICGGLAAVTGREPLRQTMRRPQIWVMIGLGLMPGLAYTIYGVWIKGFLGQQFGGRFFPTLFLNPSYYLGWVEMLNLVMGGASLILGLIGLFLFRDKYSLRFTLGLWFGYVIYGLYFNYHISTHDYYSLPLIPIVAISLAPVADLLLGQLSRSSPQGWMRLLAICALSFGLFLMTWNVRNLLKSMDYRPEAAKWAEIGNQLGSQARVVALTQDYGMRLTYWGWLAPFPWPNSGDLNYHAERGAQPQFEDQFIRLTQSREFFLVTDFDDLDRQPFLKEKLYSTYPKVYEGSGYVVFDLLRTRTQ